MELMGCDQSDYFVILLGSRRILAHNCLEALYEIINTYPSKTFVFPSTRTGTSWCGFNAVNDGCLCSPSKTSTSNNSTGKLF